MITTSKLKDKISISVKNILISQPQPENEKSPYYELERNHKVKIDFRQFIHVEGITAKEFRKNKINIIGYNAIIFTSLNAVVHFFRMCSELRIHIPQDTKYFCITESIALYLQKYIQYRKRKVFYGNGSLQDLLDLIKKHSENRFLLPCADFHKRDIPDFLETNVVNYCKAVIYRTVCSDLSDINYQHYQMIVFFSPSGIRSLFQNFPDFKQDNIRIAAFGSATAKAVVDAGLRLDIHAPVPEAPSITMALDKYLQNIRR